MSKNSEAYKAGVKEGQERGLKHGETSFGLLDALRPVSGDRLDGINDGMRQVAKQREEANERLDAEQLRRDVEQQERAKR